MMRLVFLFSLAACSQASDGLDTGYIEDVVCSHPSSQFEAQVEVNYRDNGFDSVEFVLEQSEEFWFVELQPPNEEFLTGIRKCKSSSLIAIQTLRTTLLFAGVRSESRNQSCKDF